MRHLIRALLSNSRSFCQTRRGLFEVPWHVSVCASHTLRYMSCLPRMVAEMCCRQMASVTWPELNLCVENG